MTSDRVLRILFVEDVPSDAELAERVLEKEGINFTGLRVDTREDFLKELVEFQPDLVVSDYALPGFDGMEALKISLEKDPFFPFILLTGSTNEETAVACMKAGATDYVIKERITRLPFAVLEALRLREIRREKEAALASLRESEERYRDIFRTSPDAMSIIRLSDGIRIDTNDGFSRITGYSREEGIGKTSDDLGLWYDAGERRAFMAALRKDGYVNNMELRVRRKDGSVRTCLHSARLSFIKGVEHLQTETRDITELKEIEAEREAAREERLQLERRIQQTQKMESLGVLAGGIAHDFNNILMAILGNTQLALMELSPMSLARNRIEQINTAARRAAELCRQMLAYSGKASFIQERVAVPELIQEMIHLLKTSISKKAILNLKMERELPPIQADPSQIRQIIMNLIINASEALGENNGVISVAVETVTCDESDFQQTELKDDLLPGRYLCLEISDTGCGMDRETRERIFEPFFTTKFTGRGLGLAAVLGIVRAHGGALNVDSRPGMGTTFRVFFPVLEAENGDDCRPAKYEYSRWRGQGTVLVADDEEMLRSVAEAMLERLGFAVLGAADGRDAVDLYRKKGNEIDLVLLDLTMPRMDGIQAFEEIRGLNPEVRVVLVSGYSEEDVVSRLQGNEPAGVLQKPYTIQKLQEALIRLLPAS